MTPFPKQASCRTHRESGERLKAFTFERSTRSEASAGSGAGGDAPTKCGPRDFARNSPRAVRRNNCWLRAPEDLSRRSGYRKARGSPPAKSVVQRYHAKRGLAWAIGAPNNAIMSSPITWLTVPSKRCTASDHRVKQLARLLRIAVGKQLH